MSAREVHITVINVSNTELVLESKTNLAHGEWISTPTNVPNNGIPVHFQADSDGMMTGAEGTIFYSVPGGEISLYFDNPYMGSDDFNANTSTDKYKVEANGGSGNVCSVVYVVSNNQ